MDATDHGARRQITFNPGGMRSNAGFLLLEVLISLVLVSIGLLGLVKLGAVAHGAALESYQTTQGTFLLYDIVERINAHRDSAGCFAFTSNTENGTPYLGAPGNQVYQPDCGTGANPAGAVAAMASWHELLQGSAELRGGDRLGAMTGARGCIHFDAGTQTYEIAVAWQGFKDSAPPSIACAKGLYGAESKRRVVATTLRIANLK